jgi:hypothetical protein
MHQRDYFLKLAQQFAKMLAKIMGLKEQGDILKANEVIEEAYKDLFQLDRNSIVQGDIEQLILKLQNEKKLSSEQLEILAKLIYEDAELNKESKNDLYAKSLYILLYLNLHQKMYSFEREDLIKKINALLDK